MTGGVFLQGKSTPPTPSFNGHWVKEEQSNVIFPWKITSPQTFANLKIRLSFGNNEIVFVSEKKIFPLYF